MKKQELLKLIEQLPEGNIDLECIVGDAFNFSTCKLEIIYNQDDRDYRLRMSAKTDEGA